MNWVKPVVILTNINKIILNTVDDQINNRFIEYDGKATSSHRLYGYNFQRTRFIA